MSAGHDGAAFDAGYDTAVLVVRDDGILWRKTTWLWLRERMHGWPVHDVLRVELVVAELLDNAQRYGLPRYVVELVLDRHAEILTIRVRNRAPRSGAGWPRAAGLAIVEALSEQWGVVAMGNSTTVWAKMRFAAV
ncbi:hypothetical protein B0I31_102394 [Saccharothrix carnea]|uniref:Anti-sigma regulatory factor (Ser/Thr protein kinase) n=1 Tax=Saccharothrix carnea TaxID=1280637 RepID=A0A2P8IG23_SACCR|nr:ATP-binding protein [Saccharothrix carnea]PSL57416.1 hypothetical protein B0I31_102394 [Saccharothrix carnea]